MYLHIKKLYVFIYLRIFELPTPKKKKKNHDYGPMFLSPLLLKLRMTYRNKKGIYR